MVHMQADGSQVIQDTSKDCKTLATCLDQASACFYLIDVFDCGEMSRVPCTLDELFPSRPGSCKLAQTHRRGVVHW